MKIKTSELIGEALNYAVAITEYGPKKVYINPDIRRKGIWVIPQKNGGKNHFHPSKSWAQGGALIERERIDTSTNYQDDPLGVDMVAVGWKASYWNNSVPGTPGFCKWAYGPTPLIAAMRCYVASRLGNEVEIPEELLA
jgi:hypothetical protein